MSKREMIQWLGIRLVLQLFSGIFSRSCGRWAARLFLTPRRTKRAEWENEILAQAKDSKAGENFRSWCFGQSGPLVMFVHGWSGRGSQFARFIPPLLERGYRVILFDGPAHFDNAIHPSTDIREFAMAMIECQKNYGPLRAVVGHSFGGAATALALHWGLQAERVVFLATPGNLTRLFEYFCARLKVHAKAKKVFRDTIVSRAGISERDASITQLGPKMNMPALVVHDPQDLEVSFDHALEIQEKWPKARLLAVDRVGHYRLLKSSVVLNHVVDFIDKSN